MVGSVKEEQYRGIGMYALVPFEVCPVSLSPGHSLTGKESGGEAQPMSLASVGEVRSRIKIFHIACSMYG